MFFKQSLITKNTSLSLSKVNMSFLKSLMISSTFKEISLIFILKKSCKFLMSLANESDFMLKEFKFSHKYSKISKQILFFFKFLMKVTHEFEYQRITNSIKMAYDTLVQIISKKKFYKLKKFWFDDELKNLKNEKMKYIKNNKSDPNYKLIINNYKKQSRRIQRRNIKKYESKRYFSLEQLTKTSNKDAFWRKIMKFKASDEQKNEVKIDQETLFNHYFNIFGNIRENESSKIDDVNNKLFELENTTYDSIEISIYDFENAFKKTKSSKVCGPDGVSSYLIKACDPIFIFNEIFTFFENIFKNGCFPSDLNFCYIKPILKDYKSSHESLNKR
jgi:hypothetical protein